MHAFQLMNVVRQTFSRYRRVTDEAKNVENSLQFAYKLNSGSHVHD